MKAYASGRILLVSGLLFFIVNLNAAPGLGRDTPREREEPLLLTTEEEIPDWKARWELARLLSYVKRYDEAIQEYEKVLKERPGLEEARVEMAKVLFWKGKPDEALALLRRISIEKLDEETRILLADLYVIKKQYDQAEPIYRKYLEKHANDLKVRFKLATLLSWTKRYEESLEQYSVLIKARPDDIQVRRHYAFTLSWAGKHSEAITELKKTLDR